MRDMGDSHRLMMLPLLRMRVEVPGARKVLNDVANGLVDGNLVWRSAALDLAGQNLADLRNDVVIADETGFLRAQELCALLQDAFAAVGDEPRANDEIVVDFGWAGGARPDDVHVSAGLNPRALEDGSAGAGDSTEDVCVRCGFFGSCDGGNGEVEFVLMLCSESLSAFQRTSPDDGAGEIANPGDGAEVREGLLACAEDREMVSIGKRKSVCRNGAGSSGANGGDLAAVDDAHRSAGVWVEEKHETLMRLFPLRGVAAEDRDKLRTENSVCAECTRHDTEDPSFGELDVRA